MPAERRTPPRQPGARGQRMIGPPLHLNVRERVAVPEALVTVTVTVLLLPMLQ